MKIRLAEFKEDVDFLFEVYASSRAEEMSLWGWTDEQQLQFLRMQHDAQQRSYRQHYPALQYSIILTDEEKAGRVAIVQLEEELVLVDIILLPQFQNMGVGSWILRELQRDAVDKKMPIRLNVRTDSRAQQLYERFGFQAVADSGVYVMMKWLPI